MGDLTVAGIMIRFLLGGGAVLGSTLAAKKMGGRTGGVFAAFPAVYLAALLTTRLDFTGNELIERSISLSQGALIGMMINIFCAIAAGYLCTKQGWKRGLLGSLFCWFFVSMLIILLSPDAYAPNGTTIRP